MKENNKTDQKTFFLLKPEDAVQSLRFEGDRIEFSDRTVKIKGFTVKEFIEQFDTLVFIDDKTKSRAIYLKINHHPDTTPFIDDMTKRAFEVLGPLNRTPKKLGN
jgi:hypothetical protein